MAKTIILHIQGNEITIGFPIQEVTTVLTDGSRSTTAEENGLADVWVVLRRGLLVKQYRATVIDNIVYITDKGHLLCGEYDIEVYYDSIDEHHMKFVEEKMLCVVRTTAEGQKYQSSDYNVVAYYPVIRGRASAVVIGDGHVRLYAGRGLNADLADGAVNLRAGYGNSEIEVTDNNVNIHIKE
jgi:hypothetical protein